MRETVWKPGELVDELHRVTDVLAGVLDGEARTRQADAASALELVIQERESKIAAALVGGPPAWTMGSRGSFCRTPVGPVSATFSTTWDTLADNIFTSGTATLTVSIGGVAQVASQIGSRAGFLTSGTGRLQLTANVQDSKRLSITADFPDPAWFDPFMTLGAHDLVRPPMAVSLTYSDLSTNPATTIGRYEIGEGTWTFTAVGESPGVANPGQLHGTLYQVPPSRAGPRSCVNVDTGAGTPAGSAARRKIPRADGRHHRCSVHNRWRRPSEGAPGMAPRTGAPLRADRRPPVRRRGARQLGRPIRRR